MNIDPLTKNVTLTQTEKNAMLRTIGVLQQFEALGLGCVCKADALLNFYGSITKTAGADPPGS